MFRTKNWHILINDLQKNHIDFIRLPCSLIVFLSFFLLVPLISLAWLIHHVPSVCVCACISLLDMMHAKRAKYSTIHNIITIRLWRKKHTTTDRFLDLLNYAERRQILNFLLFPSTHSPALSRSLSLSGTSTKLTDWSYMTSLTWYVSE